MKRRGSAGFADLRLPRMAEAVGVIGASLVARAFLLSLATVLSPIGLPSSPPAPIHEGACAGGAMQIVAHEDDDLLFQSPDLLHDVQAGRCVRTVFVTAGDAAKDESYWRSREAGSLAAYARMAGVADAWTISDAGVSGRSIQLETLIGAPKISVVFMRLPDGNRTGSGMAVHHHESLMRLWKHDIATISTVDGSGQYTGPELRGVLTEMMAGFRPTTVRTQDWTIPFGTGDNADHTATALFTREASQQYRSAHTLSAYGGYPSWTRLPNVTGADLTAKTSAFLAYARHDPLMCMEPWCPGDLVSSLRLGRQYVVATESTGDSARGPGVRVTASSQDELTGQTASKAVDGFALGDPGSRTKEWATAGGKAGSWIQLDFPAPTTVDGVVLYDRPNLADQITGGELVFSDGSTVPIGALANNGSAVSISFPARTTTTVRLNITAVRGTTENIGLAEFETYDNMPAVSQPPATR
jgi:LmbE family N-acetylglucosaminyl deacetylase